jgi:hypothetical protein
MRVNWRSRELDTEYLPKWEVIRKRGKWRFVVMYGVVIFGGLLFVISVAISSLVGSHFWIRREDIIISPLAGLFVGLLAWRRAEKAYWKWKGTTR